MSCFSCCEEDDINRSSDGGGHAVVKNQTGNSIFTLEPVKVEFFLLPAGVIFSHAFNPIYISISLPSSFILSS